MGKHALMNFITSKDLLARNFEKPRHCRYIQNCGLLFLEMAFMVFIIVLSSSLSVALTSGQGKITLSPVQMIAGWLRRGCMVSLARLSRLTLAHMHSRDRVSYFTVCSGHDSDCGVPL